MIADRVQMHAERVATTRVAKDHFFLLVILKGCGLAHSALHPPRGSRQEEGRIRSDIVHQLQLLLAIVS
jgi:hypothetical protein